MRKKKRGRGGFSYTEMTGSHRADGTTPHPLSYKAQTSSTSSLGLIFVLVSSVTSFTSVTIDCTATVRGPARHCFAMHLAPRPLAAFSRFQLTSAVAMQPDRAEPPNTAKSRATRTRVCPGFPKIAFDLRLR